jgi:predicted transcriptional regulator of viral defense system
MSDPGEGITQVAVDDVVHIPVTSIAKTIVDCFKFRNKIGLDVALEALRDAWNQKRVTMDELWESAEICRMTNVMRPYLESLL